MAALPFFSGAADIRIEISVLDVGLSQNTNRVFVRSNTLANESVCASKDYYAMSLGSPDSYLFYSAALTAMNEGKKMRIQYSSDGECLRSAPKVDVFWNLNY